MIPYENEEGKVALNIKLPFFFLICGLQKYEEDIQYNVLLAQKIFTTVAMINPISNIKRRLPKDVRSFLVKYPYKLIAPNVPAVTKNVEAIDVVV